MTDQLSTAPNQIPHPVDLQTLISVFSLVPIHVVITDPAGRIVFMNKTAEEKTGFSAAQALGKNPGTLWGGSESDEFYKSLWDRIKNQKRPFVGTVHNKRKDGTLFWQELNISPILDESGNVSCYIAIEPDITQEKETRSQLQQQVNTMFTASVNREIKMKQLKQELTQLHDQHVANP